eukprot:11428865-Alexandrium_andersonii.AAC.1
MQFNPVGRAGRLGLADRRQQAAVHQAPPAAAVLWHASRNRRTQLQERHAQPGLILVEQEELGGML